MADAASDYHPGDQNITEQVSTYRVFGSMTKWGSLTIATLVLMFTLWFCVGAGFFGGLIPGLVLAVSGAFFLRSKPTQEHQG
jgi:thiamine transporter ThiT